MGRPREFDDTEAVRAAMETFWTRGYEATSTAELCASTGLGRGSLYNAFGGKHQLYLTSLRKYSEIGFGGQLATLRQPKPARQRLRELMLWVIDTDLDDPTRRGCMAINAAIDAAGRDEAVARAAKRQFDKLEGALREVIEEGQRDGEFRTDRDALRLARTVQSAYYGLRVLTRVSTDRTALLDIVEGTLAGLE
ncbi:TetR/AcrR family transcriptional regulator [Pseudonocardia acaciae]|uniref:TetR/AcrR family transcriptional regulator n=1 Tax=Pseudonocardia acaciae TaxID=551276 RepID=UPI00048D98AF|nr:TetR/AcrR family transcriptional regulator [Pseudonocardia acaciae]